MKHVWVAIASADYDESTVLGVYSTKALAEKKLSTVKTSKDYDFTVFDDKYTLEFVLDESTS